MCAYYVVLLLSYICIYSHLVSKDEKDTQELIGKANFEGYPAAAMKENIQKSLPTYTKKSCKNHQKYLQNPPQRHPKSADLSERRACENTTDHPIQLPINIQQSTIHQPTASRPPGCWPAAPEARPHPPSLQASKPPGLQNCRPQASEH